EVLPVGGVNEKIEGFFRVCEKAGLDGSQGVLIPRRNRRHLMLERKVVEAVAKELFHIYTAEHASEGLELLTGLPAGVANATGNYPSGSVLGHAQKTLQAYRRACQASGRPKTRRKHLR
ncbi:MAG: ATP-dependent protease, partial [Betaproteobacteria bacterium]|nr:ATP-dependent protease [Betaproteobacteria bacterium]